MRGDGDESDSNLKELLRMKDQFGNIPWQTFQEPAVKLSFLTGMHFCLIRILATLGKHIHGNHRTLHSKRSSA